VDDDDDGDYPGGWFGKSWGAPVCDDSTHFQTPVGETCAAGCGRSIAGGDGGLVIPHYYAPGRMRLTAEHIECFRNAVGKKR